MSKNKIIMCAFGGVAGLVSLVLGYLAYARSSECTTVAEEVEISIDAVQRMNKAPISPTAASEAALKANHEALTAWQNEAIALASRGDRPVRDGLNEISFKQEMVDAAREMAKRPGGAANGCIVADGFGFGFADIITGGKMPEATQLAALQRQWGDVVDIMTILCASQVREVTSIAVVAKTDLTAENYTRNMPSPRARNKRQPKDEEKKGPDCVSYEVKFTAMPAAFVRVLNALATTPRFVTVDDFSFARAEDSLTSLLGGGKEKASANTRAKPRGRGRPAKEAETPEETELTRKGLVTDPATAAPIVVTLKLSTFDFGSRTKDATTEEAKEDAE